MVAASLSSRLLALAATLSPGAVGGRRVNEADVQSLNLTSSGAGAHSASKGRFLPRYVWYYGHVLDYFTKDGELGNHHNCLERYKVYFDTQDGKWARGKDDDAEFAATDMVSQAKFLPFEILTTGTCKSYACKKERNAHCKREEYFFDWASQEKVTNGCWCDHGRMLDLVDTSTSRCVPLPGVCHQGTCGSGNCESATDSEGKSTGCKPKDGRDGKMADYWVKQIARHWQKVTTIYTEDNIEVGDLQPSRATYPVGRPLPYWVWYNGMGHELTKDGELPKVPERYKYYFNTQTGNMIHGSDVEGEGASPELKASAKSLPFQILTEGTCNCKGWRNAVCKKEQWYDWATRTSVANRCWCDHMMLDLVNDYWSKCVPLPWYCQQGDCPAGQCETGDPDDRLRGCRPEDPDEQTKRDWIWQVTLHWQSVTDMYPEKLVEERSLHKNFY